MKKVLASSLLIFFIFTGILVALDNPEDLYEKGNSSYENGDYENAISFYEELFRIDKTSSEVFYNLGNSYFKLKKIGKAILNYERALRLNPRDKDTQLNLKLARAMAIDKINISERGFILNMLFFLYDRANINELSLICSFLYFAIILILIFSIFFIAKRRLMFYTAASLGAIFFILFIFLFAKIREENFTKTGIVIAEKTDARSGPKEDYLLQFTLHEGAKISIVKKVQGWYEIDLSKDLKGW
ncbi:MAG: tetratricopeptide repeat protein, partial [Candidatus Omnitrophica bacterium]|nr:tetratricopeptide repeat protein [Candidatus Omnitrophota bacterium]